MIDKFSQQVKDYDQRMQIIKQVFAPRIINPRVVTVIQTGTFISDDPELKLADCKHKYSQLADWERIFIDTFYWFSDQMSERSERLLEAIWNKVRSV